MSMPWFRLYSEVLNDPKLHRASKMADEPYATVLGVWTVLLALSSQSPVRGHLRFSEELWWTYDEIQEKTGLDHTLFDNIMTAFADLKLIDTATGDDWIITNWNKRQFKSDCSTERVQRFRERQAEEPEQLQDSSEEVTETLHGGSGNALDPDTDPEEDTDTDTEERSSASKTRSPPQKPPKSVPKPKKAPKAPVHAAVSVFRDAAHLFPAKSWYGKVASIVGESEANLAFWRRVVEAWVGTGWKPTNVKGMLDFFQRNEIPPGRAVERHRARGRSPPQMSPADLALFEKSRAESLAEEPVDVEALLGEGA